jgi:hypothetical protein
MEYQKSQNQQSSNSPVDVTSSDISQHAPEVNPSSNLALDPPAYPQVDESSASINNPPVQTPPPTGISSPMTTSGTVIRGGFIAPTPVKPGVIIRDELLSSNNPSPSMYNYSTDTNSLNPSPLKYLSLISLAIIIVLIVVGSAVVLATRSKSTHSLASKSPSSPHTKQAPSTSTSTPQATAPVISPTPPPTPSATSPSTAQPAPANQTITLTNQDNGRTLDIPVGTVLNINLAGVAAGYRWSPLALAFSPPLFSIDSSSHGSDGSSTDTWTAKKTGHVNLAFADIPDCLPECNQSPIGQWSVIVTVH